MFNVNVTDQYGNEESKSVDSGTKVSDIQPDGTTAYLEGSIATGDETLRSGDHVEFQAASGKAGRV